MYKYLKKLYEMILSNFYFIFLLLIIKFFLFEVFYIPSNSMNPSLINGDFILVNKINYDIKIPFSKYRINLTNPRKDDIIVFKCPFNKKIYYIKRICLVPGDSIKYSKFSIIENSFDHKKFNKPNKIIIPENKYFVLGDNLINSYDSRYWGLLDRKYIVGKAILKIFNINLSFKDNLLNIFLRKIK